jgi:hypothetical protein
MKEIASGDFNLLQPRLVRAIADVSSLKTIKSEHVYAISECPLMNHAVMRWISAILLRWPAEYDNLYRLTMLKGGDMNQIVDFIRSADGASKKIIIDGTNNLVVNKDDFYVYPKNTKYVMEKSFVTYYCPLQNKL